MARRIVPLLATLWMAACTSDPLTVMDRGTFIGVVAELRQASRAATDEADFEMLKSTILTEAGVTDSMLVEFTRFYGHRADFMAAVWDSVDRTLNPVDTDLEDPGDVRVP